MCHAVQTDRDTQTDRQTDRRADRYQNDTVHRYEHQNVTCHARSVAWQVIKDSARGIILSRLTTDGHKASRGLSATTELLVYFR